MEVFDEGRGPRLEPTVVAGFAEVDDEALGAAGEFVLAAAKADSGDVTAVRLRRKRGGSKVRDKEKHRAWSLVLEKGDKRVKSATFFASLTDFAAM